MGKIDRPECEQCVSIQSKNLKFKKRSVQPFASAISPLRLGRLPRRPSASVLLAHCAAVM